MTPEQDRIEQKPSGAEIKETMHYFGELEDALTQYASSLPKELHMTVAIRTNENGEPEPELVTETRFPPLDDLPTHFENLKFTADELDKLPFTVWINLLNKRGSHNGNHVPLQIILYGLGNVDKDKRSFRSEISHFQDNLESFSWVSSPNPDYERDNAEQCKRIALSYLVLIDQIPTQNIDTPT